MEAKVLLERRADGIGVITFNRPQARNALDLEAMGQFAEAVRQVADWPEARVLILTGAGEDAFCSGGDLFNLHGAVVSEADALGFVALMGDALRALEMLPIPVIAAVNGYALGGGSEIALACDLRVADQRARMGFVQISLALIPGWGGGQRLLRLVGYARAMELMLTGRVMESEALLALGFAQQIAPAGTALTEALALAEQIAQRPPEVARAVKALLRAGMELPYREALALERDLFPVLWVAEAHTVAVAAFIEQRKSRK